MEFAYPNRLFPVTVRFSNLGLISHACWFYNYKRKITFKNALLIYF